MQHRPKGIPKDTIVKCGVCGKTEYVNAGNCLRNGWPTCCGTRMAKVEDLLEQHVGVKAALERLEWVKR